MNYSAFGILVGNFAAVAAGTAWHYGIKGKAMSTVHEADPEFAEIEGWLEDTQKALYDRWTSTTGHRRGASSGTWACEIARRCRTCNEHLSIPCSLLQEANEIAQFLKAPCYADAPETFFRLYLIILSEFVGQLKDVAGLIGVRIGSPPKNVAVWANRWAKHKLHFLVQHHPQFAFADAFRENWQQVFAKLRTCEGVDRHGNTFSLKIIDCGWLSGAGQKNPNLTDANDQRQAVVAVPPMMAFLDATLAYFREFIDACLEQPELVRKFESERFWLRC